MQPFILSYLDLTFFRDEIEPIQTKTFIKIIENINNNVTNQIQSVTPVSQN